MPSGKQYEMLFKLNAQQNSGFKAAFSQAQAEFAKLGGQIQSLQRVQGDISAYQRQELAIQRTTRQLENLARQQENLQRRIAEAKEAGQSASGLEGEQLKLEESVRKANVSLENQRDRLNATANRLNAAGVGTDNLARKSQELSARIDSLSQRQREAALTAEEYGRTAKSSFELAGEALASAGLAAGMKQLGGAYLSTVQAAGEFASSISNVQALSGASTREIAALRAQARELGADTEFTANQSAEAMGYMGMAGWNAQQMLAGMPGVIDLAAASGEDLAAVSDMVTDSLTGFGMSAADTSRFVDVLAAASSKSNTNVSMLGESFKYAAPLAGTLGYTAEDTAVMLGLMANSGIKASQAGTTLRTAISSLVSPTKEQAAEMERLGISMTDSHGQMLSLLDLAGNLRDRFAGMSEAEQSAAASTLFGKEAMSGMLAVINASEADYNKLTQSIYNSAGAAQRMADIKLDNLQGDLTLLRSAWDGLGITIGEEFMPQLRGLVQAGTGVLSWTNELVERNPVLVKTLMAGAGAVGAVTTAVLAFNAAKKAAQAIDLVSMFAGPVGPVMALVGGAAALAAAVTGISDAALAAWPNVDELTRSAQSLDEALREAAGGYEASQTELMASAGLADHYITRLEALEGATHRTKEQQQEYHATLAMLAETMPELAGSIDLETDSIEGGTAALRRQTQAWKENAKAQAYQEALKDIYAAQAQAELEHEQNLIKLQSAQADLRDIEEQRAALMREQQELAREYGFTYEEAMSGQAAWAGHSAKKIQEMTQRHLALEEQVHSLDGAMEEAGANVGIYNQAVEKSAPILSEAEQKAQELSAALEGLNRAGQDTTGLEDTERALADLSAAFHRDKTWDFMELGGRIGAGIGQLSAEYQALYSEAYASVSGQMELFEDMAGQVGKYTEESELSLDGMTQALQSQAAYMAEYSANLQKAAELGVSQGLLAQLSDGSVESAAYLQQIVNGGQEKIDELNAAFEDVKKGKDEFSRQIAGLKTDFDRDMKKMAQNAADAVAEMDLYHEAYAAGLSTMQGYLNAINGMSGTVAAAAGNVGLGVVSAMNGALTAVKGLRLPGYASGTRNAEPGFAMVGERGPELMFFRGGETVLNAGETAALQRRSSLAVPARSGGGGWTVTVAPVYQFSGGAAPAEVENVLQRHSAALRELVLDTIRQAEIDEARSVFA